MNPGLAKMRQVFTVRLGKAGEGEDLTAELTRPDPQIHTQRRNIQGVWAVLWRLGPADLEEATSNSVAKISFLS